MNSLCRPLPSSQLQPHLFPTATVHCCCRKKDSRQVVVAFTAGSDTYSSLTSGDFSLFTSDLFLVWTFHAEYSLLLCLPPTPLLPPSKKVSWSFAVLQLMLVVVQLKYNLSKYFCQNISHQNISQQNILYTNISQPYISYQSISQLVMVVVQLKYTKISLSKMFRIKIFLNKIFLIKIFLSWWWWCSKSTTRHRFNLRDNSCSCRVRFADLHFCQKIMDRIKNCQIHILSVCEQQKLPKFNIRSCKSPLWHECKSFEYQMRKFTSRSIFAEKEISWTLL